MVGQTISHYKITEKIGQGGMGEVYRATDTKLNRDVALKLLPEAFASDKQRMARFAREAKVLASLNHPNIASIYGLEEADGKQALVLELVEGATLAERIKKGAIPLEESLKIALQITEALEAAHEKGVIHRDLKPANVKITPEGVVKVLDFGLAKVLEDEAPSEDIHDSPTISQMATKAGIILGTAAYMSPEQARGKTVDQRTDIWAFGVVLYEMLTGKQTFEGEDISLTLAAVMKEAPNWKELPSRTPSVIESLLKRCLDRDHLPGSQAVLFTIWRGTTESAQVAVLSLETGEQKVLTPGSHPHYAPTGHVVYGVEGALWAVAFDLDRLEVSGEPIPVLENVMTKNSGAVNFSSSDDGSLVYVPPGSGGLSEHMMVWVNRSGVEEPIEAEPRPYQQPRLSPDGRLLALEIEGDIWVYDLVRETPARVTFDGGSRPAWTPDGKRVVFTHSSGVFMVPVDGSSEAERLIEGGPNHSNAVSPDGQTLLLHAHNPESTDILTLQLDGQSEPQSWLATAFTEDGPTFSPDGKWIAYISNESGQGEIYVRPFPGPGGRIKVSTDGGTQPLWKANGEIFYKQGNQMMAVQVQTEPELTMSRPQMLFEGQYVYGNAGPFPSYDVTPYGQRFLMLKEAEQTEKAAAPTQLIIVQNWFEELKRLVPTGE